jgi:hypothetical protein
VPWLTMLPPPATVPLSTFETNSAAVTVMVPFLATVLPATLRSLWHPWHFRAGASEVQSSTLLGYDSAGITRPTESVGRYRYLWKHDMDG